MPGAGDDGRGTEGVAGKDLSLVGSAPMRSFTRIEHRHSRRLATTVAGVGGRV